MLTTDDEVCIPSLSSTLLAVSLQSPETENNDVNMSKLARNKPEMVFGL